jgi:CRP-like cAMP-binding protein
MLFKLAWTRFKGDGMTLPCHRSLRSVRLFASLAPETLAQIEGRCDWRTYEAGEMIFSYGDESRDVYFLADGMVRISVYAPNGRQVQFRDTGPGDWFGEFSALDGHPRSATVEVLKTSLVAKMTDKVFLQTLEQQPGVGLRLARHLVRLARGLTDRVYEFSALAVNNRIQAEILRLAGEAGLANGTARIAPAPTHADIASRVSTHREAVTREINRLNKLGILKPSRNCLEIRDIERLKKLVDDATGEA